ncbi:MAG: heavy metal translocating P-type ATPase, partial [Hymenobacteraceae bacterium]|nr:heavy metal translocating P-type ATPase [Hymenobacteraceae bacterium]
MFVRFSRRGSPEFRFANSPPFSVASSPTLPVPTASPIACAHCGNVCPPQPFASQAKASHDKPFCCAGCRAVYELLAGRNLCQYYSLADGQPGRKVPTVELPGRFAYLDEPAVQTQLLAFRSPTLARLTLHLPQMHCASCIWLLEHLYRLNPHIVESRVNFPRKEISLAYRPQETSLRDVVALLAAIGYEPQLTLAELGARPPPTNRALLIKLGLAGFAFGNVMLLAFPDYLAPVGERAGGFGRFFGYLSLALALPVLLVSARGFFQSAWQGLRQRYINLDFPISLGLAALFTVSAIEVVRGHGVGYFDSFTGLVFFLLIGKWAQQRTTDALRFDRDFTSYFPVAVTRLTEGEEGSISVKELKVGDRIRVRHQEVIPADAILLRGAGEIDYSFVTGESTPVLKVAGEIIYAGGRQLADAVELEVVREVSQGYLTQLWNNPAFQKAERTDNSGNTGLETYANRVGRWFVGATLVLALGAVAYWYGYRHDAALAIRAFTAVLVIACPCALSLATPFALGTALGIFGRHKFYLKNAAVAETLARADTLVFDKTGTLTDVKQSQVRYEGAPLTPRQHQRLAALVGCSTHPLSLRLRQELGASDYDDFVADFTEKPGQGLRATVAGMAVRVGGRAFVGTFAGSQANLVLPPPPPGEFDGGPAEVCVAFGGEVVGRFIFENVYRDGLPEVLAALQPRYHLAVLSGDHAGEEPRLRALFGPRAELRFRQSPLDKLTYIADIQRQGRTVVMIGDG